MKVKTILIACICAIIANASIAQSPEVKVFLFDVPIDNIIFNNVINDITLELHGIEENQIELVLDGGGLIKTDFLHYAAIINSNESHPKLNVFSMKNGKRNLIQSYNFKCVEMPSPDFSFAGKNGNTSDKVYISRGELISAVSAFSSFPIDLTYVPHDVKITSMTITIIRKDDKVIEFKSLSDALPKQIIEHFKQLSSGDAVAFSASIAAAGVTWHVKNCIFEIM